MRADLTPDLEILEEVVFARDLALRRVPERERRKAFVACRGAPDAETFLLDTMRLMAMGGNGHTRLIPNAAIRVRPVRLVWIGDALWRTMPGPSKRVVRIGGADPENLHTKLMPYFAGSMARRRVIGAICLAWPLALARAGLGDGPTAYRYEDGGEDVLDATVPALALYPVAERGFPDPLVDPFARNGVLRIADCLRPDTVPALVAEIEAGPADRHVFDLRGNPGGNFLNFLPVVEALRKNWRGERCAILVDRFTFSAAIVLAALLREAADGRAVLVGEEMGDLPEFHAEGGTLDLPVTGAALRHSDGFHDWRTGIATAETPRLIAKEQRACGDLVPDVIAVTTPRDLAAGDDPAFEEALTA